MRILWLCNIMLPVIARDLGLPASVKEGWLSGMMDRVMKDKNCEIAVCFPITHKKGIIKGDAAGIRYYGFYEDTAHPEDYDPGLERELSDVLVECKPDIVHCFGTEYPHTLAMAKALNDPEKLLIGIQGLMYVYTEAFRADLPDNVWHSRTFRDIIRRDDLVRQREKYRIRGEYEKEALRLCGHITGRTDWDRKYTENINPKAVYHKMNETLRFLFFGPRWDEAGAQIHSIFVSQGNYPIKGLHYLLQALPKLIEKYPDIMVYVAGDDITGKGWKISSYGKYIEDLIKKGGLRDRVVFTGPLDEGQMLERFLKSHVFLSPSSIENSPNSVGEAMLLSMSVISSNVGGVSSMLKDGEEGLLYPCSDADALIQAIDYIFDKKNAAHVSQMREAAGARAIITHDPERNYRRMLEIYRHIHTDSGEIDAFHHQSDPGNASISVSI